MPTTMAFAIHMKIVHQMRQAKKEPELVQAPATDKDRVKATAKTLLMPTKMEFATHTKPVQKSKYFLIRRK